MRPILELTHISKQFGAIKAIHKISFQMREGERICLLGPSGCGKSTLLQMVAGLLPVDEGDIMMDGQKVSSAVRNVPPEKRPVNMVFQDYALWPHMTIKENIEYGLRRNKVPTVERAARITSLARLLHLEGLLGRLPSELSGGQQQRVGIARALATQPRILLMDEPLSNLDVKLRTEMRQELALLLREMMVTTLYVTHDVMEAFALADRILVLRGGQIEQLAEPRELFENPATPWVAELMGYQNKLNATLIHADEESVSVQLAGQTIHGIPAAMPPGEQVGDENVLVMLHADVLETGASDQQERSDVNSLIAVVKQSIYEGSRWRLLLETADGQHIHALSSQPTEKGSQQRISFPVSRTRIFI
ncbi:MULTISPECIES: ABC transporter ATP-binding protein [Paenibacillus]|uniref:ABC transporter ATP-binding protein n=1 Tax=Paenibacillus TaxID=44249 RepID=UPI001180264F|nr:ABC transporter ATP-binding protein [Paenibacillus lautus]